MEERKITIIEGPPPTFEAAMDEWAMSMVEGPSLKKIAVTRVRALNGPALVERCYRAWKQREPIHLEFRSADGLIQRVPIVAAHYSQIDDADVLRLWVAVDNPDIEVDYEFVDDGGEPVEDEGLDIDSIDPEDLLLHLGFDEDEADGEENADAEEEDSDDDFLAGLSF